MQTLAGLLREVVESEKLHHWAVFTPIESGHANTAWLTDRKVIGHTLSDIQHASFGALHPHPPHKPTVFRTDVFLGIMHYKSVLITNRSYRTKPAFAKVYPPYVRF